MLRRRMIPAGVILAAFLLGSTGMLYGQTPAQGGRESTPAAQVSPSDRPQADHKAGGENSKTEDENEAYRHSPMVQRLGGLVGLTTDQAATAFEVLNFAILFVLVGGFLLKALPKVLRSRTSVIQKNLVDARTATEEASARLNSVEDRLARLDGQIAEMRAQSEKDSAADEARIKATLEEGKTKILASADQEIAAASVQAQRQLQVFAAELAIEQAARKLVISAETDRLLVQSFARRLGGETKGGEN